MEHEILRREILFGAEGRSFPLRAEERLRVVNLRGTQVVDMWAVLPAEGDEHMSMSHSRIYVSRLVPRVGDVLRSNRRRQILELVEDTSPGVHDTLLAACDNERYRLLGHRSYHRNCSDNFRTALRRIGIERQDVPDPFNLFQNTPWQADGELGYEPGRAAPGDFVTFRALVDLVVVLSACPMDLNPINGYELRDVEVLVMGGPSGAAGSDGASPDSARTDGAASGAEVTV
jgi:uncharacterized protein YcgI (DUF1989 family)